VLRQQGAPCAGADRPVHDSLHRERTSAASVSFHLCELRHITLPRIDLLCRFSLDCDPSPMAGSFLRSAVRRLALDSPGAVTGIARPIPFIKAI
jgi:hypothetical protein